MKKLLLFVVCAVLLFAPEILLSQSRSATLGKDFYVAFGENSSFSTQRLKLKIATRKATIINVTYGDGTLHPSSPISVPVGTYDIDLDHVKTYPGIFTTGVENKVVYVNSTEEIALYALNQGMVSAEATAVLPVPSLGNAYKGLSYPSLGGATVLATVASQNGTNVAVSGGGYTGSINIGDVASSFTATSGDITGMSVSSNNPVAVFAYAKETKIPTTVGDADNLFEQIWPTVSWGKIYIVPVTHRKKELVRILASQPTNITIMGGGNATPITTTIAAGSFYETTITEVAHIEADKPVAVSSFMVGNADGSLSSTVRAGDPAQCWINPVEQMTAYTITAPFYMPSTESQITKHSLIIVTRDEFKDRTKLKRNGISLTLSFINPPDIPDYAVAVISMPNTNNNVYEIENLYGLNAYVYGYGDTESYHFATGATVWDLNAYFTVDTIHHLATSQATNTYTTSGQAVVYRNIEGSYASVKWYIKNGTGTHDISTLVNDPSTGVNYTWTLPTDTVGLNPYHLRLGENTIIMEVDGINYEGKIWISPPINTHPDYSFVFGGGSGGGGSVSIDVRDNDENTGPDDKVTIYPPGDGSATVNPSDTTVIYTPDPGFKGVDTMKYCIEDKFGDISCDSIYVVVVMPTAQRYEVCPGARVTIGLEPTPGLVFDWFDTDGMTLLGSTINEVTVTGAATDQTFFVMPRYSSTSAQVGNVIIPIKVYVSGMCGTAVDAACDGSIIHIEDFGGNATTDSVYASDPLSDYYKIPYTFQPASISPFSGEYRLVKQYGSLSDHTHLAANKGRMLVVHGTNTIDTIFQMPVGDLCENLEYSFSAWISNLSATDPLIPNLSFLLIDTLLNKVEAEYQAGDISNTTWLQYGFNFTPLSSSNNLKLVIVNHPSGAGAGNIYAIDDAKIAVCIAKATAILNPPVDTICTGESSSFIGDYTGSVSDFGGSSLAYQWQFNSSDSIYNSTKWTTIAGVTSKNHTITNARLNQTGYYRLVVGSPATINKPNCVVYSNPVYLHVKACFSLFDDYESTAKNTPVTADVMANDVVSCTAPLLNIVQTTPNGSAIIDINNHVIYTPATNFEGFDSIRYRVTCGSEWKEAYLYVVVVGPAAGTYWSCPRADLKISVSTIPNITYDWYASATDGAVIADGTATDVISIIMPASNVTYYVQPHYKGLMIGDRIPVEVKLSPLCGMFTDGACDGTIFFKEDFGGNNATDPQIGSALTTPVSTGFTYTENSYFPAGEYSITKHLADDPVNGWIETTDHTSASKADEGYFMFANANGQPLTYYERYIDLTLCSDVDIYVSAWFKNIHKNLGNQAPYIRFIITDNTGEVLANYQTNEIIFDNTWKQYGVTLPVKQHTTGLKITLFNAVDFVNTGTDIAIDDIELRICSPEINLVVPADSVCETSSYTFNSTYTLAELETLYGAGNVIFKWQYSQTGNINNHLEWIDIPNETTDTYTISSVQAAHAGYYRLMAGNTSTIHKYACYAASQPARLKVLTLPTGSITGNMNLCQGETTTLTASGGSNYLWLHSNQASAAINYTPTASINLQVRVTADNGCSVVEIAPIVLTPVPVLTLTNDTAICINNAIRLQVSATGSGLTYLWNTGAVVRTIDVNPTTSQMYKVEVTNLQNCKSIDSVYVDVLPLPVVNIVGDSSICAGEQAELMASGADFYTWSTTETADIIQVNPITTTLYTVVGNDSYGCASSANFTVTIKPDPTPAITGNFIICEGENTVLTASGGSAYTWTHNTSINPQTTVSPISDTQYDVVATGSNGCSATASVTVRVNSRPVITPMSDLVLCIGKSTQLQANASGNGLSYLWNTGETARTISISPTTSQMYHVEINNYQNCKASDSVFVDVSSLPLLQISGNPDVCKGDQTELTASGATSYKWNTNDTTDIIYTTPMSPTMYTVRGTDDHGCQATASFQVTTHGKPQVNMSVSPLRITKNKSEVDFQTRVDNTDVVQWDLGDSNWSSLSMFNHKYFITSQDQYEVTLQVTNQYGCTDTARKTIYVDPNIVNTITPNGDGINDVFMANCKNCKNIQIFDRLGVKLYEGTEGWDGKFNGRYVDTDTYFYVITFNEEDKDDTVRKGYLTISRRNN